MHALAIEETKNSEKKISITVNFLGPSQDDVKKRNMVIGLASLKNSLKAVLENLADQIGQKFHENIFDPTSQILNDNVAILVNGRHYTALDGLETPLKSGDEISIFPPLGGG